MVVPPRSVPLTHQGWAKLSKKYYPPESGQQAMKTIGKHFPRTTVCVAQSPLNKSCTNESLLTSRYCLMPSIGLSSCFVIQKSRL